MNSVNFGNNTVDHATVAIRNQKIHQTATNAKHNQPPKKDLNVNDSYCKTSAVTHDNIELETHQH